MDFKVHFGGLQVGMYLKRDYEAMDNELIYRCTANQKCSNKCGFILRYKRMFESSDTVEIDK